MKKLLATVLLAQIALPAIALAAYNDVSLVASNAVLSVGGITVNVSGDGATIQSIVVNSSSFDVTLLPGSKITVSAPNLNKFNYTDIGSTATKTGQCDNTASILTITGPSTGSITTTITPTNNTCGNGSSSGGGNGAAVGLISSGGGGGGGGGGYSPVSAVTTTATPATTPATTPAPSQTVAPQATNATQGVGAPSAATVISLSRTLRVGSKGSDVRDLQVYLNTHGFVIAKRGPGSPGKESKRFGAATKAAVMKLQRAAGIKPVNGLLGPLTRAYIASHP